MQCNVGGGDKVFRIIVGLALVALPFLVAMSPTLKIVMWIIAAIALVTAFVGFCPLNKVLDINTCRTASS